MGKKITILTYGTFCDVKLCLIIAQQMIDKGHQVNFLTNSIPEDLKITDSRINYYVNDANKFINLNDPKLTEKGESIIDVLQFTPFIGYINTKFKLQFGKFIENADYVLVHYPALIFNPVLTKAKKLGIFYVAPGYPNLRIPYIFSPELLSYGPAGNKQYTTSIDMTLKMSMTSGTYDNLYKLMKRADLFTMWDPLIKDPPKTVNRLIKLSNIVSTKIIFPRNTLEELKTAFNQKNGSNTMQLTNALKNFTKGKNLVYISFGSFVDKVQIIKQAIKILVNLDYKVIYHGKQNEEFKDLLNDPNIFFYDKYIPHEWIIPHCYMILTSGSYCMTGIANYHGVYLLHAPLLREQLFWAKCYATNTDSKFLDLVSKNQYSEGEIIEAINSITSITNLKLKIYTKRLQYNVRNAQAVKKLVSIIGKK